MRCSNCSKENDTTRKFCRNCGISFILECAKCKAVNAVDDKFCGACGFILKPGLQSAKQTDYSPIFKG